jgi:DNA-binding GntR family transcriptional regulator
MDRSMRRSEHTVGREQAALERFTAIIRRRIAKDDDRTSLVVEMACAVGAEILDGTRPPGSDLNSVELARRFKTSRTPAREALALLEKEGLVEVQPRRRPRVATLSLTEIREIYGVRAALLGMIASQVAQNATDENIAELRELVGAMERAKLADDAEAYYWGNVRFHERFADLAGNRTLGRIFDTLMLRSLRFRRLTLFQQRRRHESLADHLHLVRALEERDAELAAALAKANVLSALKALEKLLSSTGTEQPDLNGHGTG